MDQHGTDASFEFCKVRQQGIKQQSCLLGVAPESAD